DPRCPAQEPSGTCSESGVSCEYSLVNSCLCYPTSSSNPFVACTQVDPSCPNSSSSGGEGGSSAEPAGGGTGGINTKIVAPSHRRCTCSSGTWLCAYGT
ncbi:MAG TPA: hypothetical protein VEQ58_22015, partial [Polyangiaceae bacterium]|nr:hypothetical protein [Polyangiaceae bacterium]